MYKCKECDFITDNFGIFGNHAKNSHRGGKKRGKRKNVYKKCPICNRKITVQNLQRHIDGHSKETNQQRRKKHRDEMIKRGWKPGTAFTEETELMRRKKISETMKKNSNAGGRRNGSGRGKKCWYESKIAGKVFLDSSYELEYAKYLDKININWKRNWIKFPYIDEKNKLRYYIPDFYLIDIDEYIEIKGYETEKDKLKWASFPYKLTVLKYKELKCLGLNIKK